MANQRPSCLSGNMVEPDSFRPFAIGPSMCSITTYKNMKSQLKDSDNRGCLADAQRKRNFLKSLKNRCIKLSKPSYDRENDPYDYKHHNLITDFDLENFERTCADSDILDKYMRSVLNEGEYESNNPFLFEKSVRYTNAYNNCVRQGRMGRGAQERKIDKPILLYKPKPAGQNCYSNAITPDIINNYAETCDKDILNSMNNNLHAELNTDCPADFTRKMYELKNIRNACKSQFGIVESCAIRDEMNEMKISEIFNPNLKNRIVFNDRSHLGRTLFQKTIDQSFVDRLNQNYPWWDNNCTLISLFDIGIFKRPVLEYLHVKLQRSGLLIESQIISILNQSHNLTHPDDVIRIGLATSTYTRGVLITNPIDSLEFVFSGAIKGISFVDRNISSSMLEPGNATLISFSHYNQQYNPLLPKSPANPETYGHTITIYRHIDGKLYINDRQRQSGIGRFNQDFREYFEQTYMATVNLPHFRKNIGDNLIEWIIYYVIDEDPEDLTDRTNSPMRKKLKKVKSKRKSHH